MTKSKYISNRNKHIRKIRSSNNVLRIPQKFYQYCVSHNMKVPKLVSSSCLYLWVDRTDTEALDELLLEASFMGSQCYRELVRSSNALTRAYNIDCKRRKDNG